MASQLLTRRSILRAIGISPSLPLRSTSSLLPLALYKTKTQIRSATSTSAHGTSTEGLTAEESVGFLNSQRVKRPLSPHMTIYQPQITWTLSIANRITGVALSGLLYAWTLAYLAHPILPAIDSAHLVQLAHDLPVWLKGGIKFILAVPFTFHTYNGIRHLLWDVGQGLTLKGVYAGGYTVLALTGLSSAYLAFFV